MTDTQTHNAAERVAPAAAALVASPMLVKSTAAQQPPTRKRATRSTDDAIRTACDAIVAAHATIADDGSVTHIAWVDALRTMRWTTGQGCDYKRFRPIFADACAAFAERVAADAAKRTTRKRSA